MEVYSLALVTNSLALEEPTYQILTPYVAFGGWVVGNPANIVFCFGQRLELCWPELNNSCSTVVYITERYFPTFSRH